MREHFAAGPNFLQRLRLLPAVSGGGPTARCQPPETARAILDEPPSEEVASFGDVEDTGAVLMPDLVAHGGEAVLRSEKNVARATVRDGTHILARHADRQVVEAVVIEVARGQKFSERVACLGGALDVHDVLVPDLVASCSEAARRPEEHVDGAGVRDCPDVLADNADRQVVEAVAVEVADRQGASERIAALRAAPRTLHHHTRYFGCDVYFGSDHDALLISPESLNRPNKKGDEGITRFLLRHLDQEIQKLTYDKSIEELATDAIARSLSDGLPKMEDVARRMGMSARSLHRRVAEEGLNFQTLTEATRRELSGGLLRDERYSIANVAFLTGRLRTKRFHPRLQALGRSHTGSYRRDLLAARGRPPRKQCASFFVTRRGQPSDRCG